MQLEEGKGVPFAWVVMKAEKKLKRQDGKKYLRENTK